MLQGYTMAIVPCGNPTPKKLPTGGGEWPTFRTAHGTPPNSASSMLSKCSNLMPFRGHKPLPHHVLQKR